MPFKRRRVFGRGGGGGSFRRRKFVRSFKRSFSKARKSLGNGSATAANMSVSKIDFKLSKFTKQIVPDRFFTWLTIENQGSILVAAGSNTGTFGFALNDVVSPMNKPGPTAVLIPNPIQAVNVWQEQGLKNLLFNTGTNTGLYNNFRVWTSIANVTFTSGNASDSYNIVVVPLSQAAIAYANPEAMAAAPNSVVKSCTFGGSGASCTATIVASHPALAGVPKNLFASYAPALGTFSATPGLPMFWQVGWRTDDNNTIGSTCGIKLVIQYKVEFLNRVDAGLLQL